METKSTTGADLRNLSECIVREVYFEANLSRLIIIVNDIFDGRGGVRSDIASRLKPIRITCDLVEEVSFQGGLRAWGLFHDPKQIGWSHSELELATLEPVPPDASKLTLEFGGARVLTVICRHVHCVGAV